MHRPTIVKVILAGALALPLLACTEQQASSGGSAAAPAPAPAPSTPQVSAGELSGTAWELANITTGDGKVATPDDPALYQLSFAPDGTMGIKADCNQAAALWVSTQPGKLAVGGMTSTLAECPPDSLSSEFLAGLQGATVYAFEGEALRLTTATGGSMLLTKA
ncbi:MAG TPA: META domain-containing protein [Kiloniellales bacterium]|nr:META domain-containing protein [Kiloniellales bacterium]